MSLRFAGTAGCLLVTSAAACREAARISTSCSPPTNRRPSTIPRIRGRKLGAGEVEIVGGRFPTPVASASYAAWWSPTRIDDNLDRVVPIAIVDGDGDCIDEVMLYSSYYEGAYDILLEWRAGKPDLTTIGGGGS